MTKHIGIVGCSSEGAALCYRTICQEGEELLGRYGHPEVTLHTFPFDGYMRHIESGAWNEVGKLMAASCGKLAGAGAEFAICPDNTIHQAFEYAAEKSPIPWLHIAEVVAEKAINEGYQKIGILGTRFLMEGPVYPSRLEPAGLGFDIPEKEDREKINSIIFNELVYGVFKNESRAYFNDVIELLKDRGCDAAVLGCTEIPLLVIPEESPLPTLDSTRLLAGKALKEATAS